VVFSHCTGCHGYSLVAQPPLPKEQVIDYTNADCCDSEKYFVVFMDRPMVLLEVCGWSSGVTSMDWSFVLVTISVP